MKRRHLILASAGAIIPGLGRAAQPCPPPQVSVTGGTSASTLCPVASPAAKYATEFPSVENPISEGGRWRRNLSNAWTNVRTTSGLAFGTNGPKNTYDDSYAYLSGYAANVEAQAVVQRDPALVTGITHEVELLFRAADTATSVRCYEALFAYHGQVEIVRWNGSLGDYTPLKSGYFSRELRTGDVVKAKIIGDTISCYVNGVLVVQASDSRWTDGQPGVGFFTRPGGNSAHFALSSYSVSAI